MLEDPFALHTLTSPDWWRKGNQHGVHGDALITGGCDVSENPWNDVRSDLIADECRLPAIPLSFFSQFIRALLTGTGTDGARSTDKRRNMPPSDSDTH